MRKREVASSVVIRQPAEGSKKTQTKEESQAYEKVLRREFHPPAGENLNHEPSSLKDTSIFGTMKPIGTHNYYVYITTNYKKTVLYVGVTNDLSNRMYRHKQDAKTEKKHFTGKYNAYYLVYWERFQHIEHAIKREKEIKGWLRMKKENLIAQFNPEWRFLNEEV